MTAAMRDDCCNCTIYMNVRTEVDDLDEAGPIAERLAAAVFRDEQVVSVETKAEMDVVRNA